MAYKLVIIGRSGHHPLVTQHLTAYPQVTFAACAPSFKGEPVEAYAALDLPEPPRAYDDWRRMLDAERPQIVVVCGRHDLNGPLAVEAARRGCHIISEKPAAQHLGELETLRDLLQERNLVYASLLNMRYMPTFYTAQRLVQEGAIGTPYLITGQKSYRFGDARPDWYGDPAQVPTWNYVAVHLRGTLHPLPHEALRAQLAVLSREFEARLAPKPEWVLDKVPAAALDRLLRQIQPFRFSVEDVDGTWKLGQNKSDALRDGAAAHMRASPIGQEVALLSALMLGAGGPE